MEVICKRYTVYLFGPLRSASPRILHPESDEFFWYHNLEIPELIELGYRPNTATGGDTEWTFRRPENYY